MKRSTLVLIILFTALFAVPFIVAGSFYFIPSGEQAVVINKNYRVLRIDNPSLQPGDVVISTERVMNGNIRSYALKASRLYYQGRQTYFPDVRAQDDTLYAGPPLETVNGLPLRLHVPAGKVNTVFLNGELIFSKGE
jgi:hypothetical protein